MKALSRRPHSWRLKRPTTSAITSHLRSHTFSTGLVAQGNKATLLSLRNMDDKSKYNRWTKDALIQRIQALESEARQRDHHQQQQQQQGTIDVTETAAPPDPGVAAKNKSLKPRKRPTDGKIDPSKYTTRLVALKLAYLGKNYGGFEFQTSANLPTIEEELWKALVKACLVFPDNPDEVRLDDWEYSKCGRTDRGVSAFGQVIAIRLRSNRPKEPAEEEKKVEDVEDVVVGGKERVEEKDGVETATAETQTTGVEESTEAPVDEDPGASDGKKKKKKKKKTKEKVQEDRPFDDFIDEVQYCKVLNRLLPRDIRILAWCPTTPEGFSARHDCRERQYRYFFTQPAYPPIPTSLEDPNATPITAAAAGKDAGSKKKKKPKDGWLDIDAMRDAAKRFEGLHDFRNFCKVDPSKLIVNFERRVFESDIVEVADVETALPFLSGDEFLPRPTTTTTTTTAFVDENKEEKVEKGKFPKVYYFHVRGSAFLWHQIRCMVAVLFMVGQGLEDPSIIDHLLDAQRQPRRPNYVLANETPLVLWDCIFPDLALPANQGQRDSSDIARRNNNTDAIRWVHLGEDSPASKHAPQYGLVDDLWTTWRERKLDELLAAQLLGLVAGPQSDVRRRLDSRAPAHLPGGSQRVFEGGNRPHAVGKYQPIREKATLPAPEEVYDREARRKGYADAAEWRGAIAAKKRAGAEAQAAGPAGVGVVDADE